MASEANQKRDLLHWRIPMQELPTTGSPGEIYAAIVAGREGRWSAIEDRINTYCLRQLKRGLVTRAGQQQLWHTLHHINEEARRQSS